MIDLLVPTGERDEEGREVKRRYRKTFAKKKDAVAEHDKIGTLTREKRFLDVKREYTTTLGGLLEKYEENYKDQPSFDNWKRFCLENFKAYFGKDTLLSAIRYVDLETYRNSLKTKLTKNKKIRTAGTINREMGVLRHAFSKAVKWDMVEASPFRQGKSLQLKEDNQRIRYLTQEEIGRLLEECRPKPHLYRIVMCALHTGMRRGEILSLKWDQIRNGFIYLEKTKTKARREIPVSEALNDLLKEIRKEQGLSSEYVFTYQKTNIQRIDRAFQAALKRAGIEGFRFHDLRHTFASHLAMQGATQKDLQELLGHKTMTMTLRYAHLSQEHKKKAVNLLNKLTAPAESPSEIFMAQNVTNQASSKKLRSVSS